MILIKDIKVAISIAIKPQHQLFEQQIARKIEKFLLKQNLICNTEVKNDDDYLQ
jgi:hypothetical protein